MGGKSTGTFEIKNDLGVNTKSGMKKRLKAQGVDYSGGNLGLTWGNDATKPARRPKNKDLLPGYGATSARDLHIQLARKGRKKVGRLTHSPSSSPIKAAVSFGNTTTVVLKPSSIHTKNNIDKTLEMKDEEPDGREFFL